MFTALTAALVLAGGGAPPLQQPNPATTRVGQYELTPNSRGCVLVRAIQPMNSLATFVLVVETVDDALRIGTFDTRLLGAIEAGQVYSAVMYVDEQVVSSAVVGVQVHPLSRGVSVTWNEREPMLATLANAQSVSVRQGETLITGAMVDGLAEAVPALRACHARVRPG